METLIKLLKGIQDSKDGQVIPYNIIVHAIQPIKEAGCLANVIYLLEHFDEKEYLESNK
jgi:hypothetical protein